LQLTILTIVQYAALEASLDHLLSKACPEMFFNSLAVILVFP